MVSSAGGLPVSMAIACSNCARCTPTLSACDSALSTSAWAERSSASETQLLPPGEGQKPALNLSCVILNVSLSSTTVRSRRAAQRVGGAEIEIGEGKLRLRRKLGVVEIGGARLSRRGVALDLPAHLAPDVEVPGAGELRREDRYIAAAARPADRRRPTRYAYAWRSNLPSPWGTAPPAPAERERAPARRMQPRRPRSGWKSRPA